MKALTKVSGAWKQVQRIFIKQGATWKQVKKGFVKQGGVWKQFYASAVGAVSSAIPTVQWSPSPYLNGETDYAYAQVPSGTNLSDHGGLIDRVMMQTEYNGPDNGDGVGTWIGGWDYILIYRETALPTYSGNLRVTNMNTGVSVVMTKQAPATWQFQIVNQSADHWPYNPNPNFIRNNATDTFKIEEA